MNIKAIAMRDAFLDLVCKQMAVDDSIYFLTGDFGSPVLDRIREQFPERFANVGVAEQNLINISAGLAIEGYKVFAYAIAPFITMRCYEQIRVNLALLSVVRTMNVNLIGVGVGYSYVVSGPTHQCYEDLSIMRALPNIDIYSPCDHITAASFFKPCIENNGIKYLRFDAQVLPVIYDSEKPNISNGFNHINKGDSICIVATGYMVHTAFEVVKKLNKIGLNAGVIDIFNITSFSEQDLTASLEAYPYIVTLEEGFQNRGGLDSVMVHFVANHQLKCEILNIGVQAGYSFELGSRNELHEKVGIGLNAIVDKVKAFIPNNTISLAQ